MRRPEGGGAWGELVRERGERNRVLKEKEIGVCVCWFWENTCDGEHVRTENTCRRRTRADGEHESRQWPAVGQREKGSRDSLFFFFHLGIVCVCCGGLVC